MAKPKRHHHLPGSYLEGFCREGMLWVFDSKQREYRQQQPINTAVRKHYYAVVDKDGNRRTDIESLLADIEGRATPVMRKLERSDAIDRDDKEHLSIYLAFMMLRGPSFEEMVNDAHRQIAQLIGDITFKNEDRAKIALDTFARETGKKVVVSAADMVKFHQSRRYTIGVHRNASLRAMIDLSTKLADYFLRMNWVVIHAPERSGFVSTDSPVSILPPSNRPHLMGTGIGTPSAVKIFPLSRRACLLMYDPGTLMLHRKVDRATVRKVNLKIVSSFHRVVIGADEAQLRSLVSQRVKKAR